MANEKNTENQSAFKELVLPVIVLVAICLLCSALLAVLNDITAPIIEENTKAETLAAYVSVLPEGTTSDDMTEVENLTTDGVQGAVTTANGDVAVKAAASGYSGKDVTVYVAFDAEGAVSNISIDASTQTTGIGSKVADDSFASGFVGLERRRSLQRQPRGCPVRRHLFQQRSVQRRQRGYRLLQQ